MSATQEVHLALYRGASADIITVEDYLALDSAARHKVDTDFENCAISVVVDGQEQLAHRLSLGPLAYLVPQFEPARQRLLAGQPALIRSGVLDVPDGNYLLFEPTPDRSQVLLSVVSTDDLPESGWFPDGPYADRLYEYMRTHRDALIEKARQWQGHLIELPLDRDRLVDALKRTGEAGAVLLSQIGGSIPT